MSNPVWSAIVTFIHNLGSKVLSYIITALPQIEQDLLEAITVVVEAAVAYVEAKYAPQAEALKAAAPMTQVEKLAWDSKRREDAMTYVKNEIAKDPSAYPKGITDSLIYTHIELTVQYHQRMAEGNGGNFPGGNSNGK